MRSTAKRSPRKLDTTQTNDNPTTIPAFPNSVPGLYPIPAYLNFVPGGIEYRPEEGGIGLSNDPLTQSSRDWYTLNIITPDTLVKKAYAADTTLRQFALRFAKANGDIGASNDNIGDLKDKIPHRLPSLSILAEGVFGSLTGVNAAHAKVWADAMVLEYLSDSKDDEHNYEVKDEIEIFNDYQRLLTNVPELSPIGKQQQQPTSPSVQNTPLSNKNNSKDLVHVLKGMHRQLIEGNESQNSALSPLPVRPCGYVFQRNDIAWNCRTCQSDSTCVVCDTCFRNSDHEGHEVYFHRTSPGGCCDCGDLEAWRADGCCSLHRPRQTKVDESIGVDGNLCGNASELDDVEISNIEQSHSIVSDDKLDFEAVKASCRGRADGEACVKEMLPPKFAAALGVVIGAAVQTVIQAVDGAAIGADTVQWTRRWADQARKVHDGRAFDEEYVMSSKKSGATSISDAVEMEFPNRFKLHLRVHNDDVHNYDEVIESLYKQSRDYNAQHRTMDKKNELDTSNGIVSTSKEAKELTAKVDNEGQVIARSYSTINGAKAGFNRLKMYGLHCSVLSSPQIDLEQRAKMLLSWLSDISAAHPAVSSLVVHALVDATEGSDIIGGVYVWPNARAIPPWSFSHFSYDTEATFPYWRQRMDVFPPHFKSSYLTREEAYQLHSLGINAIMDISIPKKGVDLNFYTNIPYKLPSERYRKSPHSLWGVMPSPFSSPKKYSHPFLTRDCGSMNQPHYLVESLIILDTDLRKQQEADMFIHDCYTHGLLGLYMISGVGLIDVNGDENGGSAMKPTAEEWTQLLSVSSYRAPVSPILLMLLLDPYPPKQLRGSIHPLFLSLLVDSRMKSRFAATLGGIAYRSLTTLYCSGVGTELDTPLAFTVQIFTTGSLVRALCNQEATKRLLCFDGYLDKNDDNCVRYEDAFTMPVAHNIVRCIHSNLLGESKEVKMVLKNASEKRGSMDTLELGKRNKYLLELTYQHGESPLATLLPAATDDAFLDARSTKHKRLPPLIRDLEYVFETPGTALRLLLNSHGEIENAKESLAVPHFPTMWCRLLRLAQGVDPQNRKINGGHVEFEQSRWLEAYSLSLHLAGVSTKLAESISNYAPDTQPPDTETVRAGMGNCFVSLLREMKWWLYKECILDLGLPQSPVNSQFDCLQRSTLHISMSTLGVATANTDDASRATALNCQTNTKMTEVHLEMIEGAIRIEQSQYKLNGSGRGIILGDWLRVPHSPYVGDTLSFHLPLHRSFARNLQSICSLVVTDDVKKKNALWWLLPTIDCDQSNTYEDVVEHPLSALLRPSLRSSNCRVTWASGPDCDSHEARHRRSRARAVSAAITATKIIHSLCDHPLRCLVAAEQISRHLWARNGAAAAGMALNYNSPPLCKSLRDLDLTMVQLSASGMSIGLGVRRVFSLLLSRFDLEGFLCDLEKKGENKSPTNSGVGVQWVMPPILQDPEHAPVLAEAFFSTICVLVTELPAPPPSSTSDDTFMKMHVRRGLLHSLAVAPLSYSKAMEAATNAITRKDLSGDDIGNEDGPTSFRSVFGQVLNEISSQKSQGSRSTAAPSFELKNSVSDEYDATFFHLKRSDHQQAMDNIAQLRKQKLTSRGKRNTKKCLPLVGSPPIAHPRFLPCRMLLHIPSLDAAIRRALTFSLTGGHWLPPQNPSEINDELSLDSPSLSSEFIVEGKSIKTRRLNRTKRSTTKFSPQVVNNSAVSFLEVLQLLTLQVHTLEDCARLHTSHPNLDHESKSLSASISINTYLGRLVNVPSSMLDIWVFRSYPDGPLPSAGSGMNKASILGLLIALYENKSDNVASKSNDTGHGVEDGLGGARFLVASGLKWLLRFVDSLVHGAPSVGVACKCALEGSQVVDKVNRNNVDATWSIDSHLKSTIAGMLGNLPDLWPSEDSSMSDINATSDRNREAMKKAQLRAMEKIKKQQANFVDSISTDEKVGISAKDCDEENDLCIICRCDDNDGESNGPMGFLGHVQRSRTSQLRALNQHTSISDKIGVTYRVVGDMGCQIRAQKAMDSSAVECLPIGSLITVVQTAVTQTYGLKSRRVFIRYTSPLSGDIAEGWASVESSTGYTILSPIINSCYNNSRWGPTRPIIKLCGHAAHLGCVDAHVASIHQKHEQDALFDGRFAAEISDGEFLCPLCKQLSNIVAPVDEHTKINNVHTISQTATSENMSERYKTLMDALGRRNDDIDEKKKRAVAQYGTYLYQAMEVSSWGRKDTDKWHRAIQSWDFKEDQSLEGKRSGVHSIGDILPLLRQQHIAWASVGQGAAAAEASARGIKKGGFEPPTSDPWVDFSFDSKDSHPMLLELRRTLLASASLTDVVCDDLIKELWTAPGSQRNVSIVGHFLMQIMNGKFWTNIDDSDKNTWNVLTPLLASIPCHVSRDEVLSIRHEARATASQVWTVKGTCAKQRTETDEVVGSQDIPDIDIGIPFYKQEKTSKATLLPNPSSPLCVRNLPHYDSKLAMSRVSMDPGEAIHKSVLFTPALASGYLYIPLLAWDLHTFAGAIFSTLLNSTDVMPQQFCDAATTLLVARLVQILVTPYGFNESETNASFESINVAIETEGILSLLHSCKNLVHADAKASVKSASPEGIKVLSAISYAILPFARSLVLLLRAAFSAVRQKGHQVNNSMESLVEDEDTLYIEDGFYFMDKFGCPLPSELYNSLCCTNGGSNDSVAFWGDLIKNWIHCIKAFDSYHGSMGNHLEYDNENKEWGTVSPPINTNKKLKSEKLSIDVEKIPTDTKDSIMDDDIQEYENEDEDEVMEDVIRATVGFEQANIRLDEDEEDYDDATDPHETFGLPSLSTDTSQNNTSSNGSNEESVCSDTDVDSNIPDDDDLYAQISSAPIIPYQPSVLGNKIPGPGPRGCNFEYIKASNIMCDLSHLGCIHSEKVEHSGLIQLPKSYVELYSMVNQIKTTGKTSSLHDTEDYGSSSESAICLITGQVLKAGLASRHSRREYRPPGACTMHARKVGSGTGIFFLVQKCIVLLIHNKKSAYSASLYVDENGEEDTGIQRGRPLYLKSGRYEALENSWRTHGIPREVAQIRSTSDRVIRDNWY